MKSSIPVNLKALSQLFYQALANKDEAEVWEYLDVSTKKLFVDHYKSLLRTDKIIQDYFDPSEYKYLRQRTGTYLLKEANITSSEELYGFVFSLAGTKFEQDEEVGGTIDEMNYSNEEENIAEIQTRGGQRFVMVLEEDGVWRTASLYSLFEEALAPIKQSETEMIKFARTNLEEELNRRLAVIAYFESQVKQSHGAPSNSEADENKLEMGE